MSLYRDLRDEGAGGEQRLVAVTRAGARARVTLDEPARLNASSARLVIQTMQALSELIADPDIRVVVLIGAGRAFSAGGEAPSHSSSRAARPFHAAVQARLERPSS